MRRHEVLLIVDEVICGFGRTGHWFGSDEYGISRISCNSPRA